MQPSLGWVALADGPTLVSRGQRENLAHAFLGFSEAKQTGVGPEPVTTECFPRSPAQLGRAEGMKGRVCDRLGCSSVGRAARPAAALPLMSSVTPSELSASLCLHSHL